MNVIQMGQEDGGTLTVDFEADTQTWRVRLTSVNFVLLANGHTMEAAFVQLAQRKQEAGL